MGRSIDAAARDGITIGMIDAIISIANALDERLRAEAKRLRKDPDDDHAWHSEAVRNAMADLAANKALRHIMWPRDERTMRILRAAADLHQARGR